MLKPRARAHSVKRNWVYIICFYNWDEDGWIPSLWLPYLCWAPGIMPPFLAAVNEYLIETIWEKQDLFRVTSQRDTVIIARNTGQWGIITGSGSWWHSFLHVVDEEELSRWTRARLIPNPPPSNLLLPARFPFPQFPQPARPPARGQRFRGMSL